MANGVLTITFVIMMRMNKITAPLWVVLVALLAACNTNNVTRDEEIGKFFSDAQVNGTFGIFDNAQGQFTVYNLARFRDSAYLPASTFNIFNALAALGTGAVFSDTVMLTWDGTVHKGPGGDTMHQWNRDMTLREAFEVSNVPAFRAIARKIGKDTMQMLLDSIGYGRRYDTFRITGNIDTFWLDNTLRVTADEQLGFVKKLYFRQLPFQNREQELVRSMMVRERNDKYILAYKTGWGVTEKGTQLGWMVGWIEENKHVYPFAMNLETANAGIDMVQVRLELLKKILTHLGFFEGRK